MKISLILDDNTKFLGVSLCVDEGEHTVECSVNAYAGDELYDGATIDIAKALKEGK